MSPKILAVMTSDARSLRVYNFFAADFAGLQWAEHHGPSGRTPRPMYPKRQGPRHRHYAYMSGFAVVMSLATFRVLVEKD